MFSLFHFPTAFFIENSDLKRTAFGTLLHVSHFNEGVHHKRLKVSSNFSGMLLRNCINVNILPDPQSEHFFAYATNFVVNSQLHFKGCARIVYYPEFDRLTF